MLYTHICVYVWRIEKWEFISFLKLNEIFFCSQFIYGLDGVGL